MTWTLAIDVGGTFTDTVADDGKGRRLTVKVPSAPEDPSRGLLEAPRDLGRQGLTFEDVGLVFHGTTIATNAVINDRLARVVLLTTKGFRDILTYRSGSRPDAYDLRQDRPKEFVPSGDRIEVAERITSSGVVDELTGGEIERVVQEVAALDPDAVAVSFLFSYLDDSHERSIETALTSAFPELPVARSSEIAREFREYPRTVTTVVNAGLRPVVSNYLLTADQQIRRLGVPGGFLVMQSNGGGVPAARAGAEAHKLLVSGPSAGVAGVVALGASSGRTHLLSLDMGGTSADVCLIRDGKASVIPTQHIEAHPILSPSIDIYSAGAGGGSIVEVDSTGRLKVGPRSAGADPGPAAYGRGGTHATVTDAHVVAGTLGEQTALGGRLHLDRAAAIEAMSRVGAQLGMGPATAAEGALALASAHLEAAIRRVSIERGEDPRNYSLVAFGGAGPLHAGRLLRDLGMPEAVIPRHPGLFSAAGLLAADLRIDDPATILRLLDPSSVAEMTSWFESAIDGLAARIRDDGIPDERIKTLASIDCRYRGQGYELNVTVVPSGLHADEVAADFHRIHSSLYGHASEEPIEAVTLRVSAFGGLAVETQGATTARAREPVAVSTRSIKLREMPEPSLVQVYAGDQLGPGASLRGPVIIEQLDATTLILDGQSGVVDAHENLWIREG